MHELRKRNNELFWENWDCRYIVSCYNQKFENTIGCIEQILQTNDMQEIKYYARNALRNMDTYQDTIEEIRQRLFNDNPSK